MLIEFKIGNFLSFKEVQTLRMAHVLDDGKEGTSFGEPSDRMFIYGANGSGKSNLIKAMAFARDIVLYGRSDITASTFRKRSGHSYFEYVIEIDGTVYSYGFEINPRTLDPKSEWLYILGGDGDKCLYESEIDDPEKRYSVVKRGELLLDSPGSPTFYERGLLFVPHLRQIPRQSPVHEHARKVLGWFTDSLFIENSRMRDEVVPVSGDFFSGLGDRLADFDTGITGISEEPFVNIDIPENLVRRIPGSGALGRDGDYLVIVVGGDRKRYWAIHAEVADGRRTFTEVRFVHEGGHIVGIEDESLGTLRIIQILALYSMMERRGPGDPGVVVADELECSIHSLVMRRFVETFGSIAGRGQLIATTHRTDILGNPSVKDGEVSFMDNDGIGGGGSRLYTLRSFDRAFGPDERRKAYIDGRMAAVPVLRGIGTEDRACS